MPYICCGNEHSGQTFVRFSRKVDIRGNLIYPAYLKDYENIMKETMQAVRKIKREPGAELVETPIPETGAEELLVRVKATSICGTDVHIFEWDEWSQNRIKNLPQTLGHEFCGEVIETGENVSNIEKGDFISAETHIACGHCVQCKNNQHHICSNLEIVGVDTDGCFAEYISIPEQVAWEIPESLDPEYGSVLEPLGNAVYCSLVEPVTGKTVAITGDGPTGLLAAGVCRAAGAGKVILIGMEPERLKIAARMGADITVNIEKREPVEVVMDETGDVGVDVFLEMAGAKEAVKTGFECLRKGGRYSAFGILPGEVSLDYDENIVFKGATIYGINGREIWETWRTVNSLLEDKRLDISPIITHKLPLKNFEEGINLMRERPKSCGKVVLFPDGN